MFIPGPNKVSTLFLRSSSPTFSNNSSASSKLKEQPIAVPFGMENAFVPQSIRIPEGPSAQQAMGIPLFRRDSVTPPNADAVPGVTFGEHIPSAWKRQISSSSESCEINAFRSALPLYTSTREMPVSPVYGSSVFRLFTMLS